MPSGLTPSTVADASLEDQLLYWQEQRAKIGGVRSVSTRGKTIVYDQDWIATEILRLERELNKTRRLGTVLLQRGRQ